MLEPLLVANDLDCDDLMQLVVEAFERLTEAARAKLVHNFKAIGQMVLHDDLVVASLVIKAEIVPEQRRCLYLFGLEAQKVDLLVVLNLNLLVIGHALVLEELQGLAARHRESYFIDSDRRRGLLRI